VVSSSLVDAFFLAEPVPFDACEPSSVETAADWIAALAVYAVAVGSTLPATWPFDVPSDWPLIAGAGAEGAAVAIWNAVTMAVGDVAGALASAGAVPSLPVEEDLLSEPVCVAV
jgi:hypothetical protein